ncbi:MAG TPA: metallophosphoesterase [Kiritimatiellia bacterium]|nr:metallophosphoesterase [Kiritimatiellia bacterium]
MINRRQFLATSGAAAISLGWPKSFSWAAQRGPQAPLRIVFFTDVHARVEWDTPKAMFRTAHAINETRADMTICGGDCITDGFQSSRAAVAHRWQAYREHLRDHVSPRPITVLGNHDLVGAMPEDGSEPEADPRAAFREELGIPRTTMSFDAAGYQIILLDSVQVTRDELKYRGFVDEAQLAWLRGELARIRPEKPIVLVTHMPLLTSFFQATEGHDQAAPRNRVIVNNREVFDCFANHRLHLVLQGHLHVNEMLRWRDTTFITGGAVCGKWWRGPWHGTEAGFGELTLRQDRVDWEYKEIGWVPRRP